MKPRIFLALLLLLVMGAITACQTTLSLAPTPADLSTKTFTPTNTLSPVFTQSPSFTWTRTFTFTVTPTATPTGIPGFNWYQASTTAPAFSGRWLHSSVVYNGNMWVISGDNVGGGFTGGLNDVWSSPDGKTWNQATVSAAFPARSGGKSVTFNDGSGNAMWLISGLDPAFNPLPDVWKSTDGITWSAATTTGAFGGRLFHDCVVYGSPASIWVIAGQNPAFLNDVWSSPDGINWTQKTAAAAFNARLGHTVVSFGGLMYLIGGLDGAPTYYNDVWSSPDGITWTQVLANGPASSTQFPGRYGHTCLVYNGALWVIGGYSSTGPVNDVWTSTNGSTWTQVSVSAVFNPRYAHSSVVFNNSMWVIDGYGGVLYDDVWRSP